MWATHRGKLSFECCCKFNWNKAYLIPSTKRGGLDLQLLFINNAAQFMLSVYLEDVAEKSELRAKSPCRRVRAGSLHTSWKMRWQKLQELLALPVSWYRLCFVVPLMQSEVALQFWGHTWELGWTPVQGDWGRWKEYLARRHEDFRDWPAFTVLVHELFGKCRA